MSLPTLTFEGRVNKAELRYTPQGKAVFHVDVACNSRRYNKDTNQWENGDVYWLNGATLWDRKGEAASEAIKVGDIVTGTCALRTRSYEKDGQKRQAVDHLIESIGKVAVPARDGSSSQAPSGGGSAWGSAPASTSGQSDPWGGGGSMGESEPPF